MTQCHFLGVMYLAKDTFENLKTDKKEKVLIVLKKIFQEKPFQEVTVKEIVEELGIARGGFYQYLKMHTLPF